VPVCIATRMRLALEKGTLTKLRGRVEADETFIGGKVHNMHRSKKLRVMGSKRGGTYAKAVVMAMLERETGKVRARIIENVKRTTLKSVIRENIEPGAELITAGSSRCRRRKRTRRWPNTRRSEKTRPRIDRAFFDRSFEP
jgi:hypothetical protein